MQPHVLSLLYYTHHSNHLAATLPSLPLQSQAQMILFPIQIITLSPEYTPHSCLPATLSNFPFKYLPTPPTFPPASSLTPLTSLQKLPRSHHPYSRYMEHVET
ncbi:hypothetical protein BGX38DRAFT_881665 [Terfezia claveryi]|nr:hypothetical protein BGX38DRAFT_881665 [Terfezia claveryi]